MNRFLKNLLLLSALLCVMVNCRKKAWDDYYGRPDSLEPPIYQVLESKGNFKHLLACIDKAGYKSILSSAGYWTLYAATDEAFEKYFASAGISGIDKIDSVAAQKIVRYNLVYNAFNLDRLDDYQSGAGWVVDNAFRRRTAYYELFDTATVNGSLVTIAPSNRNNSGSNGGYVAGDNNNKYISYFTSPYFTKAGLSSSDYDFFYPGSSLAELNVLDAKRVQTNIAAENGYIHTVDKVLTPLPNLEKYLASKPEYSLFKSLFDRFLVTYAENTDASTRYRLLYNKNEKVYVRLYNQNLAYSLNNENFLKNQDNDGQSGGWSLFVPTNAVLEPYLKSVVLEHYANDITKLDKLPQQVIVDFLNGHMWQSPVWPSKFDVTNNFLGEPARFNKNTDVADKKILSNGFFYGVSKVQQSNWFTTVFSRPYLDPQYSLMTRALNMELKSIISNPTFWYTVFMLSDSVLQRLGYGWSSERNTWKFTSSTGTETFGDGPKNNLVRLLNMYIVYTPNDELSDLTKSGTIDSYGGELIKYSNNQVVGAGNLDSGTALTVLPAMTKQTINGTVYYTKGNLAYSTKIIGKRIEELSTATTSPYYQFFQYLKNSSLYTAATGEIKGLSLGTFASILIPDNAAVLAAVNAGLLPGTGTAPNKTPVYAPTATGDRDMVEAFIKFHILKKTVIANGRNDGNVETLYRNQNDEATYITVSHSGTSLYFKGTGNTGVVAAQPDNSNVLADRIVIHSLSTYLRY